MRFNSLLRFVFGAAGVSMAEHGKFALGESLRGIWESTLGKRQRKLGRVVSQ